MNNRLLLLLLMLASLGLCVSGPVFAGKVKNCDPDEGDVHPSCGGDGGGGTSSEYTAALTAGGFRFGSVEITPNNRDTGYTSTQSLDMDRPNDEIEAAAWDAVFEECYELLGGTQIPGVFVDTDWGITQGGKKNSNTARNIRVTFRTVIADNFQEVDLWIALINWAEFPRSDFLPARGDTSVYFLDTAKVYGDAVGNSMSCNSGEFPLLPNTRLEICHKWEDGSGCG
jgi:hypothetical protein